MPLLSLTQKTETQKNHCNIKTGSAKSKLIFRTDRYGT